MTEDDACTVCKVRPRLAGRYRCEECTSRPTSRGSRTDYVGPGTGIAGQDER